jgi:hypothetical protein
MPKARFPWLYVLAAMCAWAASAPALLHAGPRIGPVASLCPSGSERHADADGKQDRCLTQAPPTCPGGSELRTDAKGESDRCLSSTADSDGGKTPKCGEGFRLVAVAGTDHCQKSGPPTCPAGFTLKGVKGQDQCHY